MGKTWGKKRDGEDGVSRLVNVGFEGIRSDRHKTNDAFVVKKYKITELEY